MTKKFLGVVHKNDLEGGTWELELESGQRYQLVGGGKDLHHEGMEVEVEGRLDRNSMGIGFATPRLEVKSYKRL